MIRTYNSINQIDSKQWDELIKTSSHRSAFQTQDCYRFFESLSFMEAFVCGVSEDDELKGVIVGFIIKDGGRVKQFLSRRAIINGGPLLAEDISDEALSVLLETCAKMLKHRAIYIEIRNFNDYSRWRQTFEKCRFKYEPHYNFQIDTSSADVTEQSIGKSRKRDVRYSFREGAEVITANDSKQIEEYYSILHKLYKSKVKTPLFPYEFFEKLYESNFCVYKLVTFQNRVIGGTLCVYDDKTVYEWFACGEDGVYKNIYPSTLATYAGIQYSAQNGFERFDMMGAGEPGDKGYGVRDFKAKFGGKLVEQGRFKLLCHPLLFAIGKVGVWVLKKIK